MEPISAYAVPGIAVYLILKEVFGYIRNRNGNGRINGYCAFGSDRDEIRDLLREIAKNTRPK